MTTMPSCAQAYMDATLSRKHAAKMISEFAINNMGKQADTTKNCSFVDMNNESQEMREYSALACQL